jgi:hypothetical protein
MTTEKVVATKQPVNFTNISRNPSAFTIREPYLSATGVSFTADYYTAFFFQIFLQGFNPKAD